jgi:hypothetical protein
VPFESTDHCKALGLTLTRRASAGLESRRLELGAHLCHSAVRVGNACLDRAERNQESGSAWGPGKGLSCGERKLSRFGIKLDVKGHEREVLKGMASGFTVQVPQPVVSASL